MNSHPPEIELIRPFIGARFWPSNLQGLDLGRLAVVEEHRYPP